MPKKPVKLISFELPNGETFEVKETLWRTAVSNFEYKSAFQALKKGIAFNSTTALTTAEKTQGKLYYFFAYILRREGSKNPETTVSKENFSLLQDYLALGGDPNLHWLRGSLLMSVLAFGDYRTICSLLENERLDVNWSMIDDKADDPLRGSHKQADLWDDPRNALQAFATRYEPRVFQGLHCSLVKNAFKGRESATLSMDNTALVDAVPLTPLRELQDVWKKLEDRGVDFYSRDLRGCNPLLWATKCSAQELMPFLIRKYTTANRLAEMILQPDLSNSTCALSALITDFILPSRTTEHPHLGGWLRSITRANREFFRTFVEHEKFPKVLASLICDSPELLGDFDKACTQCGIHIPGAVWALVLQAITREPTIRQVKLFTEETLLSIIKKSEGISVTQLIRDTLSNRYTPKYAFLEIALSALEKQHTPAQSVSLISEIDTEREWNVLCYLMADLNNPEINQHAPHYFKQQSSMMRTVWKKIVHLSSAEARIYAGNRMGVNNALFDAKQIPINKDGLTLQQPPTATATATATPTATATATDILLNPQSTHTAIVHSSTSTAEIVLRDRYKMRLMPAQRKTDCWGAIDRHYLPSNAFELNKMTLYVANLRRSVQSEMPAPGDSAGKIKTALTHRLQWIDARIEEQAHLSILRTAFTEYLPNHSEVHSEKTFKFIEYLDQGVDWFKITYKVFKKHTLASTYKDPGSQQNLADVFLSIWLAIHDKRYELTEEVRAELRGRLGIAMIEIVHQYQAMQPACASGCHNLLIDAVGKGDHIPGVYSFSMQTEKLLLINTLKTAFSVEEHFNALSPSEKSAWFESATEYDQAVTACSKKLAEFIQFGANEEFQLFTQQEIEQFKKTNDLFWATWKIQHSAEQPCNESLIASELRGLGQSYRTAALSSLDNFRTFIRKNMRDIPGAPVESSLFQAVKDSIQSTEEQIALLDYSSFFSSKNDVAACVKQHWNDYYSQLTPKDVSMLLLQLGAQPLANNDKNKAMFARLDLKRLLEANGHLRSAEQETIRAVYQEWLEELEEESEEPEDIATGARDLATALAPTNAPAITPHAILKRGRQEDDEPDVSSQEPTANFAAKRKQ